MNNQNAMKNYSNVNAVGVHTTLHNIHISPNGICP